MAKAEGSFLQSAAFKEAQDAAAVLTLEPVKTKKRRPGSTWDGRVSGMSLKEYRERKWSLDAGFAKTLRGSPSFTCRPQCPLKYRANDTILKNDVIKSFNATAAAGPKFSMGASFHHMAELDRTPGPQYFIQNSLGSDPHPTLRKNCGAKFGTEILLVNDQAAPAPGDYDANAWKQSSQIKKSASWTCEGREAWGESQKAPAPGAGEYNSDKFENALKNGTKTPFRWTMQGKTEPLEKPRGERRVVRPGPDHYNPPFAGPQADNKKRNNDVVKNKAPNWGFSKDTRGF